MIEHEHHEITQADNQKTNDFEFDSFALGFAVGTILTIFLVVASTYNLVCTVAP